MPSQSFPELRAGLVAIFPAAVAVIPFGLVLGAAAAQKGLSPAEVALMSSLVFAGASQFVAVDLWSEPAPWLALGLTTLLINLRFVLMSASLAGKLRHFPPLGRALVALSLSDEIWAMAERRAGGTPLTAPFLLGLFGLIYLNWVVWTVVGTVIGSAFGRPEALGFDFAFTAIFIGLIAGFWKSGRTAWVIGASAGAAALTYLAVDGPWYVLTGAFAGCGVAALMPERAA